MNNVEIEVQVLRALLALCAKDYGDAESILKGLANKLRNTNNISMSFRYDEKGLGIVAIEYADQSCSEYCPYWLLPDEIESVIFDEEREQND